MTLHRETLIKRSETFTFDVRKRDSLCNSLVFCKSGEMTNPLIKKIKRKLKRVHGCLPSRSILLVLFLRTVVPLNVFLPPLTLHYSAQIHGCALTFSIKVVVCNGCILHV